MTRATIDFGIDLGTTNSTIAVLIDGRPQPIRNNEQQEITPSAVMVERDGSLSVGQRAYRAAEIRPQAVAREFKRAMGIEQTFALSGRSMTPEELSAEVLKVLRTDAQARLGEEIRAAVITVPAMFTLAGCDATTRAAALAGIEQCVLLQEPIAAGIAYGAQENTASGYWVVYDLGGGTFDAALMTIRDRRLQVIDHAGDEFLGGKNFDDILVDHVVEQLHGQYRIDGVVRGGNPQRGRLYATLKAACEDGKKVLSRQKQVLIEIVNAQDDDGEPIDVGVTVQRITYDGLIDPLVTRTTTIVRDLLERNNLKPEMVQRVIMVGGPTLTPLVRRRVQRDTGIQIETRIDPMTVVAQGAAIYAGSQLRRDAATSSPSAGRDAAQVTLKYPPVSDDTEVMVGGRVEAVRDQGLLIQIERDDRGWTSGRIPISNGTFVTTIALRPRQANTFTLRLFDNSGLQLPIAPDRFAITHGLVVDEPPLSRSLGIAIDRGGDELGTKPLLERGTRLPATGQHRFKTSRPITPGQASVIKLHVVEGEAMNPDRNDHVCFIQLDGQNVRRALPQGTEIDVKIHVDTSRRVKVEAFVPMLDETFDTAAQQRDRPVPDIAILEHQISAEEERVVEISQVAPVGDAPAAIQDVKRAIREARGGDEDAAMRAQRRLRELQAELDSAKDAASLPLLQAQWRDLLPRAQQVLAQYGEPPDRQRLLTLEREGQDALRGRNQAQLRQRVEQLEQMYWGTLFKQPGWWIGFYQDLVEQQAHMVDPSTARVHIQEGRRALDRQDFEALQQMCWRLWDLLPNRARGQMTHGLPDVGIRA